MKINRFAGLFLVLLLAGAAGAAELRPFSELWNNFSYYDTNLERKSFASILGRFEGKLGAYVLDTPWQIYGAYYGVTAQDNNYWNNSILAGAGVRLRPLENLRGRGWYYDEWLRDIKIFAESLSPSYQRNAASAEAANLAKTDTRYGIDLWHEWNLDKADLKALWGELWLNWSNRTTNFGWEDFNNYILYFQPKVGRHLGTGIEAYLRLDVTMSGKGGPTYSHLNIADYGAGIRFEPWRHTNEQNEFLKKFKMFIEVVNASYLKEKPTDATKAISGDVRFGIDFSQGRVY